MRSTADRASRSGSLLCITASALLAMCSRPPASPVERGRATFVRMCSGCHGMNGTGGGMPALNQQTPPRDLTDPTFQAERTDEQLAFVVRNGKGNMPAFGVTLTAEQIQELIAYVRTLKAAH